MSAPSEPAWKRWLDRLLMVNVLLVFIGAGVFAVAVVQQGQGHDWLMDQVQLLWQPLFAPAISLLIMAALVSGIFSWCQLQCFRCFWGTAPRWSWRANRLLRSGLKP